MQDQNPDSGSPVTQTVTTTTVTSSPNPLLQDTSVSDNQNPKKQTYRRASVGAIPRGSGLSVEGTRQARVYCWHYQPGVVRDHPYLSQELDDSSLYTNPVNKFFD